jgi:hypothetical protein
MRGGPAPVTGSLRLRKALYVPTSVHKSTHPLKPIPSMLVVQSYSTLPSRTIVAPSSAATT